MPNMSYCRFQNTLRDLRDCYEHIDDDNLGPEETKARKKLIILCSDISQDYDYVDLKLD